MKAFLLAALAALMFPSCKHQSPSIDLRESSSSSLVSSATLPCHSESVINIDQYEKRIILEQHYDSDSALKGELVRRTAVNPSLRIFVRADRRVRYDVIANTLLLIREAGISEVYLAFRRADSPREAAGLGLRN